MAERNRGFSFAKWAVCGFHDIFAWIWYLCGLGPSHSARIRRGFCGTSSFLEVSDLAFSAAYGNSGIAGSNHVQSLWCSDIERMHILSWRRGHMWCKSNIILSLCMIKITWYKFDFIRRPLMIIPHMLVGPLRPAAPASQTDWDLVENNDSFPIAGASRGWNGEIVIADFRAMFKSLHHSTSIIGLIMIIRHNHS